jgi:hypothetical protein
MHPIMRGQRRRYWLIGALFMALVGSFALCSIGGVGLGPALGEADGVLRTEPAQVAVGLLWLMKHGVHGAAVVILPLLAHRRYIGP